MESGSGISIVIPTWGRASLLRCLLNSIVLDLRSCSFPIDLILADSSEGSEKESVTRISEEFGANLLVAPHHVGEARNVGVRHAGFDFVLFLDSDVTICPGTLRAHHEALEAGADACLGVVEFAGRSTCAWQVVERMQIMLPFRYPFICKSVPWGPTANLSFRRSRLLAVGGFDPDIPPYGGEDVDLGFRFTDAGFRIVTSKTAVAKHTTETWAAWSQNIPRLVNYGRADFYLIERHPNRTYADLPSQLIAFATQVAVALLTGLVYGIKAWPMLMAALLASIIAHHVVYAQRKRLPGSPYWPHLGGPIIINLLDFGKILEAIKKRKPKVILVRLKYLDDIIERDWREIAASAWGVYTSMLVFLAGVMLASTRSR
jgi:GT2 family glycosyltransferase